MRILGIDPAFSVTGYGLIDLKDKEIVLVEAGVIITSAKQAYLYRLDKIYKGISNLIEQYKPEVMVLEKLFAHHRHPTTAYLLGQVKGVATLICAQKNILLTEYAATRIKKAITGYGSASKNQVQRMVVGLLNINKVPKYTDVTDALALAIGYSYINKKDQQISL